MAEIAPEDSPLSKAAAYLFMAGLALLMVGALAKAAFHQEWLFAPAVFGGCALLIAGAITFMVFVRKSKQPPGGK